jgi:hypothetical protein
MADTILEVQDGVIGQKTVFYTPKDKPKDTPIEEDENGETGS